MREHLAGAGMSRAEVVSRCEELIKSFNPLVMTVDSFALQALGEDCEGPHADPDKALMRQVLYGCVTRHRPLKVFLTHFYGDNAAFVLRSDYSMYLVFAYLILFRLEELKWSGLEALVAEHEPGKMFHILSYIFLGDALQRGVKQEWLDIFDIDYIDNVVCKTLESHRAEASKLCANLEVQAFGTTAHTDDSPKPPPSKIRLTVPRAPNLHPPRRRKVPMPTAMSSRVVVGHGPPDLNSNTLEKIARKQDMRMQQVMQQTMAKYDESTSFHLAETRASLEKSKHETEMKRQAAVDFDRSYVKDVPDFAKETAIVRLNKASILREEALYKKKTEVEVKQLKASESDLGDCTEFLAWQAEVRAHDKAVHKARVDERRMRAKCSAAEAKAALERQKLDNLVFAQEVKKETVLMQQQRHEELEMTVEMNRQLVKEMQEIRDVAPKVAKEVLVLQQQERSRALREEMAEALAKKLEHDAVISAEKVEKIKKLKEENQAVQKPVKVFDPTTTSGHGFLNEVSLVEVRERLIINREKEREEEEKRRRMILQCKALEQEELRSRVENIKHLRGTAQADAKAVREHRLRASQDQAQRERRELERRQATLLQELEQKRVARAAELEALREEEHKVREQQKRLQERKTALLRRHQRPETSPESSALDMQAAALRQARIEAIRAQRRAQTQACARGVESPCTVRRAAHDAQVQAQKLREALAKVEAGYRDDIQRRQGHVQRVRQQRRALHRKLEQLNPYAHRMSHAQHRHKHAGARGATEGAMTAAERVVARELVDSEKVMESTEREGAVPVVGA